MGRNQGTRMHRSGPRGLAGQPLRRRLRLVASLGAALLVVTGLPGGSSAQSPGEAVFDASLGRFIVEPVGLPIGGSPSQPSRLASHQARDTLDRIAELTGLRALMETTRLRAEQDTFVSESKARDNFGRLKLLYVGGPAGYGKSYSYLWFDMSELAANQAVTEADVELYLREAGPANDPERRITAYPVELGRFRGTTDCRDSWDERDPTWDDPPDRTDEVLDRTDVGTTRDRYSLDIADAVVEWRRPEWNTDNRCNGGIVLHGDDRDGSYRGFDSSEGSNEPELRIKHATDTRAPRGGMDPLPRYVTQATESDPQQAALPLRWWGEDPDPGTGIDYFDLYGRGNTADWGLLAGQARSYGGRFIGFNGVRYEFAIYPTDPAGNVKPAAPADAVTHFDFDPPQVTIDPLPEYMPGPFELRWTGVDLPNAPDRFGSGIDYYTVHYNIGGGSWGLLADGVKENHVRFDQAQQGQFYQFRVMGVDNAGHREADGAFEAQTFIDGLPPVVSIEPVNSIDNPRFVVRWSGVDLGSSGIVSYDLQMREDWGPWVDWDMATSATSRAFEGEYGHMYSFRARARDRAGNLSDWPNPPQLVTAVVRRSELTVKLQLPIVTQRR